MVDTTSYSTKSFEDVASIESAGIVDVDDDDLSHYDVRDRNFFS